MSYVILLFWKIFKASQNLINKFVIRNYKNNQSSAMFSNINLRNCLIIKSLQV
jgi:hypothetical protein